MPSRAKSTYLGAPSGARQTVAYTGAANSSPELDRGALLLPGIIVEGRYQIEQELGHGGMASVYRARHIEIGATVAIKVMHPRLLSIPGAAEGFLLEARAISRIRHHNVVTVSDFGRIGGRTPFMVMEHLHGEDLFDCVSREGPLPWSRVRAIALQLCEGLHAVHSAGLVHRDVKPENCFLVAESHIPDFVKLIDFGVAKALETRAKQETEKGLCKRPLQSSGAVAGTPDFMAPEEVSSHEIDHRVDVYSLGATLFVLLTGRALFHCDSVRETILSHARKQAPAPSSLRPGLPPEVDALILRALAKSPKDRFADMRAFARAVEAIRPREVLDLDAEQTLLQMHAEGSSVALPRVIGRQRWWIAAVAAACTGVATVAAASHVPDDAAALILERVNHRVTAAPSITQAHASLLEHSVASAARIATTDVPMPMHFLAMDETPPAPVSRSNAWTTVRDPIPTIGPSACFDTNSCGADGSGALDHDLSHSSNVAVVASTVEGPSEPSPELAPVARPAEEASEVPLLGSTPRPAKRRSRAAVPQDRSPVTISVSNGPLKDPYR